jgi:purine-binding chemotaxis protein CheW
MTYQINSFLTIKLGDELFAVSVNKVNEILEIPKITKVPRAPEFMRGVVNLRGSVLSVVDSRIKFGLPPVEDTINTCIIVMTIQLEGRDITMGFIVDEVKEVIEFSIDQIQGMPEMGARYKSEFIEGMVKSDNQFIMLLNVNLLFSSQETSLLEQAVEITEDKSIN